MGFFGAFSVCFLLICLGNFFFFLVAWGFFVVLFWFCLFVYFEEFFVRF